MSEHVVICGGGVIGAAVAYELARRGVRATVVESDGIAAGASGAAAGLLTPPMDLDALTEIRRVGFEMHAAFAETLPAESGVEYGYERVPRVLVAATAEEEAALRRRVVPGERPWLSANEIRDVVPWVDRVTRGGILVDSPAQLDPYRFTLALVTASERLGASVRSGRVRDLRQQAGSVVGVVLEREVISADAVVIAMGPWSNEAGSWLGLPIPVEPLKGQILKVRPREWLVPSSFGRGSDYGVTKPGGLVYLGTTEERAGFDRSPTVEARDQILRFGVEFSSALEAAELVEQTACLRPLSADALPLIGPVPGVRGAWVATGHGRQGILQAPPTGRAIADLIVDGRTDCLDVSPFEPGRFLLG